ncbi:MAG: SpoIIE family protein phosphatase [Spirochaetales bacterium]|nr:SpoIIE family protein phosphatase [Spirochaetales bacterium]
MIPELDGLIFSSAGIRVGLAVLFLLYVRSILNSFPLPRGKVFLAAGWVFLFRDLVFLLFPLGILYRVGDLVGILLLLVWVRSFRSSGSSWKIAGVAGVILGGVAFLTVFFPWPLFRVGLQGTLILGTLGYLGLEMGHLSSFTSRSPEFIQNNRRLIFWVLFIPRFFSIFNPLYSGSLAPGILLPLGYAGYFLLLSRYQGFLYKDAAQRHTYSTEYIAALYDFMRTIGGAMNRQMKSQELLEYVVGRATDQLGAEAGGVFLKDENVLRVGTTKGYFPPPFPVPAITKSKLSGVEHYFQKTPIPIETTVLGKCASTAQPIYIRNTREDSRMALNSRDDTLSLSSLIASPLIVNNKLFGVLSIVNRSPGKFFSSIDFERFKVFADFASLTLESLANYSHLLEKQEIEREVSIAADIQTQLLPGKIPKSLRQRVAAFTTPAKGVSGDYYDILPLNGHGKLGFVICDVAGKGIPASLIMVMIRTIVHLVARQTDDPAKVVSWINWGIAGSIDIERFATLSYFTYDPETGVLDYSNAAHHPLVIYRIESSKLEILDTPGLPIGLEKGTRYQGVRTILGPGDRVMVYTDGVIEAMNLQGEQYEDQRLFKIFGQPGSVGAPELMDRIRLDLKRHRGTRRPHDDQTLILMIAPDKNRREKE